jgi:hypothetical protein
MDVATPARGQAVNRVLMGVAGGPAAVAAAYARGRPA